MPDGTTQFLAPNIGALLRDAGRELARLDAWPQPVAVPAMPLPIAVPVEPQPVALPIAPPAEVPAAKPKLRIPLGSFWLRHWLIVSLPMLAFIAFLTLTGPVAAWFIGPVELVVVDKTAKKLWLMRGGERLFETDISLGKNPKGQKLREGDHRTPEGVYTLGWRDPRSDYHLAILVSYPGKADIARAKKTGVKPGGGIMIHGQKYFWRWFTKSPLTNGCIGVSNVAMDIIWSAVGSGTKIEIRP